MERIVAAIIGAFVGALLKYLYDRYADRSEPIGSVLRVGPTASVPTSAKDVLASFPANLAERYNAHPSLPSRIDPTKEIHLDDYARQVRIIREAVRVTAGIQERGSETIRLLFQSIDRDDHLAFARTLAEHDRFVGGWIVGRARRHQSPPASPPDLIEVGAMTPRDGLQIAVDSDGDYVISVQGEVHTILLPWFTRSLPAEGERVHKVLSGVVRDIAEFRSDNLRGMLGAVERDVRASIDELRKLLDEITREERRYSFLEVAVLMRNRGRRAYATDSSGRLFLNAAGYSFRSTAGTTTLNEDIELELVAEGETPESELTVIKPGEAALVRFVSKLPFESLSSHDALAALGNHGERSCRVGTRLFREGADPELFYTPPVSFRTFEAGTAIPKPA